MAKKNLNYVQPPPARRPLKIYAFDPMLGRTPENRITIDIPNERLAPGPQGERVEVIDFDGANQFYYPPVNLEDPAILMQNGLEPTESDPRFHQQMVYAVAMKVIENFDIALGRRINFTRGRLRLFPHAFQGANAFYDRSLLGVLFGYFRADKIDPGPNLPGQTVFTCLSHDIIAHEVTHALVDRLRRFFMEPSNHDVSAFHEGFSDIVAIFQHFSFPAILRRVIQETRGDLRSPTEMINLACEFGYATGAGQALRSAVEPDAKPDPKLYQTITEPHERGAILVAAVFDAFFTTYQRRIQDLIRIATGGTGRLPEGDLHPDLVNRIAAEATRTSQTVLTMCIRAFDYLPPVDVTFGDYLRALVTADFELNPTDDYGLRAAMIESFRSRGIYADNVSSLAEDSLLLTRPHGLEPIHIERNLAMLLMEKTQEFSRAPSALRKEAAMKKSPTFKPSAQVGGFAEAAPAEEAFEIGLGGAISGMLTGYARRNAADLGLNPNTTKYPVRVLGFHPVFRISPRGQLLVELVAQFSQRDGERRDEFGGVSLRGGTTLVAAADGTVRYVAAKPLPSKDYKGPWKREAELRERRQTGFVRECDRNDAALAWTSEGNYKRRIAASMNFSAIHSGVLR
ncbi:MAG TPA: hypothetical protein VFX96_17705 [Pyrinomonadaceae bacterium]|nr:hypothetical protein [Pyrinomonadaceae bacterium]